MDYPIFRKRNNASNTETSYFVIQDNGYIGKLKANDTAYIYNGQFTQQTEDELIASSQFLSIESWVEGVEDNANFVNNRVGSTPHIRAH